MQIGVVFPQTEIGASVDGIAAWAEAASRAGFAHILAYDHVLGADTSVHTGWRGPYDLHTPFHEPMVLFGYLAARTTAELVTGIVILPQRQTALVAKQAVEVDVLTGGRFRLGVGIGWNKVEYDALGKDFSNRGRRMEEQVALLRLLWTDESVSFRGDHEQVVGAGLAPLPVQRPIPIWMGGSSEPAYRRMGRLADGWFPQMPPGEALDDAREVVRAAAAGAGRDPDAIGMEGRVTLRDGDLDKLRHHVDKWRDAGASHVSINTMGSGLTGPDAHVDAIGRAAEAVLA